MSNNGDNKDHSDKFNSDKDIDLESNNLTWNSNIDNLLAKWCDESKCYGWMHSESYSIDFRKSRNFLISINLLTALTGVSNIITGSYSVNGFQISWMFGGISIIVSSLNVLQDKLGYQQQAELHKRLANQWSMITYKIEEIIILPYTARQDCKTFLKFIKKDINKALLEGASSISNNIINKCFEKFKNIPNFNIPDICGQMEHTHIYNEFENNSSESNRKNNIII
jgi:hypothetical protein